MECIDCAVCMETYTTTPLALIPCGHTFCTTCVSALPFSKCPLCATIIRGTIVNYAIISCVDCIRQLDSDVKVAVEKRAQLTVTALTEIESLRADNNVLKRTIALQGVAFKIMDSAKERDPTRMVIKQTFVLY
jgi:RING-type zinc-finger